MQAKEEKEKKRKRTIKLDSVASSNMGDIKIESKKTKVCPKEFQFPYFFV